MSSSTSSTAAQPSPRIDPSTATTNTPPPFPSQPTTTTTTTTAATTATNPTSTSGLPPPPAAGAGPSARHTSEARHALVASLSNLLDAELTPRATALHSASAALTRQERDLARATGALRAETERLGREAEVAGRGVKMLGDVQNWAEVLEREFIVLEDTMRMVQDGGGGCDSECCSCDEGPGSGSGGEEGGKKKEVDMDAMERKLAGLDFGSGDTGRRTVVGEGGESGGGADGGVERKRAGSGIMDAMARKLGSLGFGSSARVDTAAAGNAEGHGDRKEAKGKAPVYPSGVTPGNVAGGDSQAPLSDASQSLPGTDSPAGADAVKGVDTTSLSTT